MMYHSMPTGLLHYHCCGGKHCQLPALMAPTLAIASDTLLLLLMLSCMKGKLSAAAAYQLWQDNAGCDRRILHSETASEACVIAPSGIEDPR
jgi:hypothetical protein